MIDMLNFQNCREPYYENRSGSKNKLVFSIYTYLLVLYLLFVVMALQSFPNRIKSFAYIFLKISVQHIWIFRFYFQNFCRHVSIAASCATYVLGSWEHCTVQRYISLLKTAWFILIFERSLKLFDGSRYFFLEISSTFCLTRFLGCKDC